MKRLFVAAACLMAVEAAATQDGFYSGGKFQTFSVESERAINVRGNRIGLPIRFAKDASGYLTDQIVFRVQDGVDARALAAKYVGFRSAKPSKLVKGMWTAQYASPRDALDAANRLHDRDGVKYAHPDFVMAKKMRELEPMDEPFYSLQWHLHNGGDNGATEGADIKAPAAWSMTQGSDQIIIGVLDGGFEIDHPDLRDAWLVNAGEIAGNDIDDDGNGFVDDVYGWNFDRNSNNLGVGNDVRHGTAVSGLAGARANGIGVTGVCPNCKLLPVTLSWTPSEDAEAFAYAAARGAHVMTNSWGYAVGSANTDAVVDAINEAATTGRGGKGVVILFAMNNIDQDDCAGNRPDISSLDSVIAVSGASDRDLKVRDSAWGACMDILSPTRESRGARQGIVTTDMTGNGGYNSGFGSDLADKDYTKSFAGTSAATPIAAGIAGLVLSVNPELTAVQVLELFRRTADKVQVDVAAYDEHGFSNKYGYGRVNAEAAVRAASEMH